MQMLDLFSPVSGNTCAYSGNFLVCSIQVLPLEGLLVDWACSGLGRGKYSSLGRWEGERGGKIGGRGTYPLKFRLLA